MKKWYKFFLAEIIVVCTLYLNNIFFVELKSVFIQNSWNKVWLIIVFLLGESILEFFSISLLAILCLDKCIRIKNKLTFPFEWIYSVLTYCILNGVAYIAYFFWLLFMPRRVLLGRELRTYTDVQKNINDSIMYIKPYFLVDFKNRITGENESADKENYLYPILYMLVLIMVVGICYEADFRIYLVLLDICLFLLIICDSIVLEKYRYESFTLKLFSIHDKWIWTAAGSLLIIISIYGWKADVFETPNMVPLMDKGVELITVTKELPDNRGWMIADKTEVNLRTNTYWIDENGILYGTGSNKNNQLGKAERYTHEPQLIDTDVISVSEGEDNEDGHNIIYYLKKSGEFYCLGGQYAAPECLETGVEHFIAKSKRYIVLKDDGSLITSVSSIDPEKERDIICDKMVCFNYTNGVFAAIDSENRLFLWGNNQFGQLGVPVLNQKYVNIDERLCYDNVTDVWIGKETMFDIEKEDYHGSKKETVYFCDIDGKYYASGKYIGDGTMHRGDVRYLDHFIEIKIQYQVGDMSL